MLVTAIIVAVVLLAACLVPLIIYGDPLAFFKRDAVIWGSGAVALLLAILINLMADKFPRRFDLTAEKKYSVSQELKNILSKLDDQAKITYYVYANFQEFAQYKRNMLDKLGEIKNASGGKIELEVVSIDPNDPKDEQLLKELKQKGFESQANTSQKDEMKLSIFYSGLKLTYKDKDTEYLPRMWEADELEYELASRLIPWTLKEKAVVAIDSPPPPPQQQQMPGRRPPQGPYDWLAVQGFDPKRFDVKQTDLTENNSVPKGTRLLILMRPKEFNERQRYEVIKYLAEGGSLLYVAAPFKVSAEFGSLRAEKAPTGLENYFKEFGVTLGEDFIGDHSHMLQIFKNPFTGEEMQRIENPLFLKIRPENIDQESVLTRLMPGLVLPHAAEIILDDKVLANAKLVPTVLARTTDQCWKVPFHEDIKPDQELEKEGEPKAYLPKKDVFAMIKGQFPFPYDGKPVPDWPKSGDGDKEKEKDKKPAEMASAAKKEGTLVICTSADAFNFDYLTNQYLGPLMQNNAKLLANISESLSLGDDLIRLRTKRYETRTLSGLEGDKKADTRQFWKIFLIALAPMVLLIVSIYYFVFRRVNQLRYERNYAGTTGPSSFSS